MAILKFEPDEPRVVALKYPDGREVTGKGGPQFLYTTMTGDTFYLNPQPAAMLQAIAFKPGEAIHICKRPVKNRAGSYSVQWEFKRASEAGAGDASEKRTPAAVNSSNNQPHHSAPVAPAATVREPDGVMHTGLSQAMSACLIAAVDSCITAEHYGLAKKMELHFNEEDVRAVALTLYIQLAKVIPAQAGFSARAGEEANAWQQ